MKLLWIAAPAVALGVYMLARRLLGRRLGRSVESALTALMLLGYVVATAALGLFWVARMDLPAFDLHYSFGYVMLVLLGVHVALQLERLSAALRRASPRALLDAEGRRFSLAVRLTSGALLAALLAVPGIAYVLGCISSRRAEVVVAPKVTPSAAGSGAYEPKEVWIMRSGERTRVVDWLYDESRLSRAKTTATPVLVTHEPDSVKSFDGEARRLPPPKPRAGRSLSMALAPPQGADALEGAIVTSAAPRALDLSAVATLLHYANGVTSRKAENTGLLLRAAASAGALYPIDVYAVSSVLGEGVHYYHPHLHALFRSAGSASAVLAALPPKSAARRAPVLFVLSATFDRSAFKYRERALRYVLLDAGHVAENVLLTGRALGVECALEPYFDDARLSAALGVNASDEGALLVIGCGLEANSLTAQPRPNHEPAALPKSTAGRELTRLSHELTSWQLVSGGDTVREQLEPARVAKDLLALPQGEASARDVLEVISERRSMREMKSRQLPLAQLAAVLSDAWAGAHGLLAGDLVELFVLSKGTSGLAEGSYRYLGDRHALVPTTGSVREVQRAGLDQETLGLAAAVLVWAFRQELGQRDGPRDFRVGAFQAGLGGEAAYLSATARGLGVCGVGAFYDDELAKLIGGANSRPLYLVAVGPR